MRARTRLTSGSHAIPSRESTVIKNGEIAHTSVRCSTRGLFIYTSPCGDRRRVYAAEYGASRALSTLKFRRDCLNHSDSLWTLSRSLSACAKSGKQIFFLRVCVLSCAQNEPNYSEGSGCREQRTRGGINGSAVKERGSVHESARRAAVKPIKLVAL